MLRYNIMTQLLVRFTSICFLLLSLFVSAENITPVQVKIKEIAKVYSASMTYIFRQQALINSQTTDKAELFGTQFIDNVKSTYKKKYSSDAFPDEDILAIKTLFEVMIEVMEDNKTLLLDEDITFKGFIPAIFAFQISQRYSQKGIGIKVKFTNELARVRNKFNNPDTWEIDAINKLKAGNLAEYYDENGLFRDKQANRYIIPVPMSSMCLTCHGEPQDNPANYNRPKQQWTTIDKTGFKMEHWQIDDFGGAISVTIYDAKITR